MENTIKNLNSEDYKVTESKIKVSGWVLTARFQSKIGFISINDGSCFTPLQIVTEYTEKNKYSDTISRIKKGISITVSGILIESPSKHQKYELKCNIDDITVYGNIDAEEYPMSKKKHSLEHVRKYPHLRIRTNTIGVISRIRSSCSFATHQFFQERDYTYVHTPLITTNDCEGAGETFCVTNLLNNKIVPTNKQGDIDFTKDFFETKAYLTVSGQLHVESFALGLNKVYTFGPTFRAENSNTSRHLAEFWMIEPEICFINLDDLMTLAENYIKYCINYVLGKNKDDIEFIDKMISPDRLNLLKQTTQHQFKRISYTESISILSNDNKTDLYPDIVWGDDLSSDHEKYLTSKFGPCIVYNYPTSIKSFYMKRNEDDKTVMAMDVLLPGIGEIIGGSIREDDHDKLLETIKNKKIDINTIQWYLDLRKFGTTPHGGFGLGFERLIMLITGISNIRDVIPFPRYPGHCVL